MRFISKRPQATALACSAALLLLCAATARSETDRSPGLIYGDGYSFLVTPPPGWILDAHAGAEQGLSAVFYPEGATWAKATTVMYVNTADRPPGVKLDDFIATNARDFTRAAGPAARVSALPALAVASGTAVPVQSFSGDRKGNREAVAYIESPDVVVLVVLTSRKSTDFEAALPAFRSLVASWEHVGRGQAEVFKAAQVAASQNEETPAGARYVGEFATRFGELSPVLQECTRQAAPGEIATFDVLARIGADGAVEEARVQPETRVALCLCDKVRKARFGPPPEPGWWVQVRMDIRP